MSDDLIRQIRDAKPPRRGRPPGPRKVRLSVDVLPETKKALAELSRRGFPAEYSPTPVRLVGEIMTAAGVRVAMSDADFLAAWQSVPSF